MCLSMLGANSQILKFDELQVGGDCISWDTFVFERINSNMGINTCLEVLMTFFMPDEQHLTLPTFWWCFEQRLKLLLLRTLWWRVGFPSSQMDFSVDCFAGWIPIKSGRVMGFLQWQSPTHPADDCATSLCAPA